MRLKLKHNRGLLFFYLLSMLLGVLVGLMSTGLRVLIAYLAKLQGIKFESVMAWLWPAMISALFIGVALYLVRRFAPEASGSGVQEIEGRLLGLRPMSWRRLIPTKFLGACLSIGSKMVLGREGPTIQIGGNLGAMLADFFKLNRSKTNILIGAGAASGLAAAFNAPLAGVLFILEEMRQHFKLSAVSFKAVTIACVMATIVMRVFFGYGPEISMHQFAAPHVQKLFLFFIFGIVIGFIGLLFNKVLIHVLDKISVLTFKSRLFYALMIAGLIGLISYKYDYLVGGGYNIIQHALHLDFSWQLLLVILVVRFILTILCYSTGVPGGIFAPLLAIGTVSGVAFGSIIMPIFDDGHLFIDMFAVAGMGGLFAACIRAPITGIVLIVEMTQNYQLILPLMITCLTATTVVQFANNQPLYHQLLHRLLPHAR